MRLKNLNYSIKIRNLYNRAICMTVLGFNKKTGWKKDTVIDMISLKEIMNR